MEYNMEETNAENQTLNIRERSSMREEAGERTSSTVNKRQLNVFS
jgi:hypothetical protein